ncbi:alpha/beta fold hydrolase [Desulfosporosinus metallidurans]|uniref:Biotin synthesis protein BioH n=1 Tax=Desulfosporosinus metallidurans TaxID=1888891 RepID=A0A1Q8R337_9FIRM|nr:alpha/beta fold hydrolase [Desulfosporosinus metallidurans]OLN34046.1 Biotin synthesis protein BioH [Desulfosporosinus metallidurans]
MAVQNIVLIHGWAADESIWQETKNYLDHIYRVYTLNLPLAKNQHSYCDAVIELIEQNGLAHVILVGWSMGALVAIQVVHQLPNKVQGLVLVSGTSRFLADSQSGISVLGIENTVKNGNLEQNSLTLIDPYAGGIPAALVIRMKKRLSKNCEQTISDFYKLMFSTQEQVQGLAGGIISADLGRGRTWDIIEAQEGLNFLMEADFRAELKAITCPTLLLHGEQDEICPLEGAMFIKRQIPCAQLVSYPGVGHIPFLTNFEGFQQALKEWLAIYDDK